jgi:hypothetical protein
MTFARGARVGSTPKAAPESHATELSAALYENEKRSADEHDLYGLTVLAGVEYRIRAWRNTRVDGSDWIKLRFSPRPAK